MPKVSVNLCCYNSERFLKETLASVFAQTYKDYELVVVNDGSKDGTEAIIRKHADSKHIVYHSQQNAGLGAARNKALELSKGEFIAILDHDDVWEPAKLETQMALFNRAELGFVGSDALFIDSGGKPLALYSDLNALHRGKILNELFLYDFVPCAAVVMRRSAIEAAGGFFKPDFHIAEEYEMFLRLAERFEYDFVPEPLVRIRVHSGSAGWDVGKERAEMRQAYRECLLRNPGLAAELGARALSIKEAGLWLRPAEAAVLRGEDGSLTTKAKAEGLYLLSLFGSGAVDQLLTLKRAIRRKNVSS